MTEPVDRLTALRARLQAYLDAEARILQSQEYAIGQGYTARRNRRADLEQVRAGIADCEAQIAQLQATTARTRRVFQLRPR